MSVSAGASRSMGPGDGALERRVIELEGASSILPGTSSTLSERIARLELSLRRSEDARMRAIPWGSPVQGGILTSPASRARLHPILRQYRPHTGVDIAAAAGTPIRATADGLATAPFDSPSYGIGVDLDHGRGTYTRYAHMQRAAVRRGQRVRRGDVIGFVGSTGRSTGPHVHYEVFRNWRRVDPASFLPDDLDVATRASGAGDY